MSDRMGLVYLDKNEKRPPEHCHYASPKNGERCRELAEPGKAYCKGHEGLMPAGPGLGSSLNMNPHIGSILGSSRASSFPQRDKR